MLLHVDDTLDVEELRRLTNLFEICLSEGLVQQNVEDSLINRVAVILETGRKLDVVLGRLINYDRVPLTLAADIELDILFDLLKNAYLFSRSHVSSKASVESLVL